MESTALALAASESPPALEPDEATRARAQQMVADAVKDVAGAIVRLEQLIDRYPYKFMAKHSEYLKSLVAARIQAAELEQAKRELERQEQERRRQAKLESERAQLAAQLEKARLEQDRQQREQQAREQAERSSQSGATFVSRSISGMTSSSFSGPCGAPTKKGGSCRRRVAGGGYCYQHR